MQLFQYLLSCFLFDVICYLIDDANFIPKILTGVQRKLEMNNQDVYKNDKSLKSSPKQARYRPPARNSPTSIYADRTKREVSDAAEKLANMTVGSGRNDEAISASSYEGWRMAWPI
ncbi:uncharacterized protein LOC117927774 [Vitis riparia]|uniref:uncharacterized protein LOC117927774 n=1 Tax=Vitis riparia TaxID=96939 RepID=UPI00155A796F|nr:uncharacterized protein LOC117927774 [Vitis riparia]